MNLKTMTKLKDSYSKENIMSHTGVKDLCIYQMI